MSILKKLAGQTALYGLSSMLGRALNFLLVPLYASVLLVGELGVYTEMYAYVAFFNVVYLFGMETTYFRFANKDKIRELEIFNSAQTFILILSTLLSGLFILLSGPIASLLNYPDKGNYIVWLALIMGVDAIVAIPFAKLRLENKAAYFAFAKLTNIGLNIGLNLFFLVICKGIYEGTYLTEFQSFIKTFYHPSRTIEFIFISNFIANVLMIPLLWKYFIAFRIRWNREQIEPMFLYAYPLMFMGLAGMVNEVLDRILLKPLLPLELYPGLSKVEVLGIYGGCYKLSMFMTLAVQSFRYAADPFFFSKAQDKNAPELFAKVMNWFVVVCCFMFLAISLYADPIASIVLPKDIFKTGLAVVPLLLLANLFLGIYYNLSVWYKLTDKTYWGTLIGIGGALFTIVGNIVLIPLIGYMGAAYTTLACYFLMAALSYWLGNNYFPVPYDLFSVLGLIISAVVLERTRGLFKTDGFWTTQMLSLVWILAYMLIVFYFKKTRFQKG